MKAIRLSASAVIMAVLALGVLEARRSDPVGIYCIVQKVVMAPDECNPTTVQVWGAFAMAIGGMQADGTYTPGTYAPAQKGYLYYSVPKGKDAQCLKEWTDLKDLVGTGTVVGLGGRYTSTGRLRWADEKPQNPDVYPLQMGLVKLTNPGPAYASLVDDLKKAAGVK
jgi:hypothetical protein